MTQKRYWFFRQESSECLCKPNVEGSECDQCKEGTFDLEETNPDGCKDCFCFGKTSFCSSHERLVRDKVDLSNSRTRDTVVPMLSICLNSLYKLL